MTANEGSYSRIVAGAMQSSSFILPHNDWQNPPAETRYL
jgi:hypothetical protein